MSSTTKTWTKWIVLLISGLMILGSVPGLAGTEAPAGGSGDGFLTIANGPDQNVDGFLSVAPDDYGQWASLTFGGGGDLFNPTGAFGPLEATFSSALFAFVPARSQRTVLTENPNYTAIASDGSLTLAVTSPLAASDTNMDGADDTLLSSFTAIGTGTALSFDLTQVVVSLGGGVALLQQDYVITNTDAAPVDLVLARVYDGDLLWAGGAGNEFANDEVGTNWNAVGGDRYVFEQEPGDSTTAITISSPSASAYFGGKNGVQPGNGPPPYNFGTDTEVFDNFGVPASWVNHIAGVGYDTDGTSGPTPAGSVAPEDGFAGLGAAMTLGAGASTTVTIVHTYGQNTPGSLAPPTPIIEIPTVDWTGLVLLAVLLALAGALISRRRVISEA